MITYEMNNNHFNEISVVFLELEKIYEFFEVKTHNDIKYIEYNNKEIIVNKKECNDHYTTEVNENGRYKEIYILEENIIQKKQSLF